MTISGDTDGFHVFDTTLRDGAQRDGISFTLADKLAIARHLDDFGVGFIEGGWPGSNPRDTEFFRRMARERPLRHADLVAFGSTRRPATRVRADSQVAALLRSDAPVVTLVAKAHERHVLKALRTDLAENLAMIGDTVAYLRTEGRRVFLDCEHFFDGYRADPAYALSVVATAAEAGADVVVLCDTNGGTLPPAIGAAVRAVLAEVPVRIGMHAQDDGGCAVANTLAAVDAGATHVQCTANGYGERVGNADLFSVVAALELKYGRQVLPVGALALATRTAHAIADVAGLRRATHQPYVGTSAFTHKAGLHISAIVVDPDLYQHIDPASVGNEMHTVVSDLAGRAAVELKCAELGHDVTHDPGLSARLATRVKEREARGYSYQNADASFELLLHAATDPPLPAPFEVRHWRVVEEPGADGGLLSRCEVGLVAADGRRLTGIGQATDVAAAVERAFRDALAVAGPDVDQVCLVRTEEISMLRPDSDADASVGAVRVRVRAGDGQREWSCVGVGPGIAAAMCEAWGDVYRFAVGVAVRAG